MRSLTAVPHCMHSHGSAAMVTMASSHLRGGSFIWMIVSALFCCITARKSKTAFFFSFFFLPPHETSIIHHVVPVTDDVHIPHTEQT